MKRGNAAKNDKLSSLKKDFSKKLPSSTPVASPRVAGSTESSAKKEVAPKARNETPSSANSVKDNKTSKSSANCPVPKPRKIVNATSNGSVKEPEISVVDQESDGSAVSVSSIQMPELSSIASNGRPEVQEGCNLYLRFLYDEVNAHKLEAPSFLRVPESSYSVTLRHAANEFSNSSHRLRVRDHAESVQLESLSIDAFFELLDGLFKEGGVTYERVLVLFFFCTDITVRALRDNLVNFFNDLVGWTLKFFSENLFDWVQRNGGWARVLEKSMDFTYKALLVTTLCFSTLALISYLRKK
nr:PREDICTED: uncharacterized protein LOC109041611 [Bemisia tabaci]